MLQKGLIGHRINIMIHQDLLATRNLLRERRKANRRVIAEGKVLYETCVS